MSKKVNYLQVAAISCLCVFLLVTGARYLSCSHEGSELKPPVVVLQAQSSSSSVNDLASKQDTIRTKTTHNASVTGTSDFKVPNIVHYIWYEDRPVEFRFDKAICVLSAIKYIKPEIVYFHTNMEPFGIYYDMLKNISIFKVVFRKPPSHILKNVYHETDYSNYDKVKIIMEQGGIYLDLDVMVTKSFDELRRYDCTIGYESTHKVCSGVIVCAQGHTFLYLWLNYYYEDFRSEWAYNSGTVSTRIIERYPELVHTDRERIHRPNFNELDKIWGSTKYNWRENFTIHTWIRLAITRNAISGYPSLKSSRKMNCTYGEIVRDIFNGSPEIINS